MNANRASCDKYRRLPKCADPPIHSTALTYTGTYDVYILCAFREWSGKFDQGLSLVAWPYSQPEGIRAWLGDSAPEVGGSAHFGNDYK
jgi:hypothetical protein